MSAVDLSHESLQASCIQAALEVLETMFFEFPTGEPALAGHPPENASQARAVFSGSARGELRVSLSSDGLRSMAAAFLGIEEDEAGESEQLSMVVELANVLCGSTLSRIQPAGRLHIDQPVFGPVNVVPSGPWLSFPLERGCMSIYARIADSDSTDSGTAEVL